MALCRRVFLNFALWEAQPKQFLANVSHFVKTAHLHGVSTMLIPFDLCWFGCRTENVSIHSSGKCWYPSPQCKARLPVIAAGGGHTESADRHE